MAEAAHPAPAKRPARRRPKAAVYVNLTNCKYDVVYESAEELGWRPVFDDDNIEWNLFWTDTSVSTERVMRLQKFQKTLGPSCISTCSSCGEPRTRAPRAPPLKT